MTRDERIARTNHLLSLHEQVEEILLKIPGVRNVDIGLKERDNEVTDEITFRVNVSRKKAPADILPEELIPKEVLGIQTDVVNVIQGQSLSDSSEYRPIKGGIQLGNGSGATGTMGCMARRNVDNVAVILSNSHVMMAQGKKVGDKIGQPDLSGSWCCVCGEIGTIVLNIIPPNGGEGEVDAAIATLDADIRSLPEINQIGPIAGTAVATPGDIVRKVGAVTGLTTGTVLSVIGRAENIKSEGSVYTLTRQVMIRATPGTKFSDFGDSGAVVINEDNKIVALLIGKSKTEEVAYAAHIATVMAELKINIPANEGDGPINLIAETAASLEPPTDNAVLVRRLERTLRQTGPGLAVLNVIQEYRFEVMQLINHNRAVGVIWQRRQGPAFVAALFRSLKEPTYRIPREINDISIRSLLMSMATVLDEHGSPRLRTAIDKHAMAILEAADEQDTIEGILSQLTDNPHAIARNH